MSPVLHLAPGTIFAGDFRIVSPLNAGGMGAVYVADQLSTGFQRALKIMLPELLADQELRDRFLREARVCAHIQSDHIVQVVAAGIDLPTSTPWLAMELLHGEDLSEYIIRRERVTPSGLVEIYRQLCHGLGSAHAVGVVHRDLKPENIFLAVSKRAGAPFTVKVLDFGIAKMIADASAKMTALIGSPLWMAPEQMDTRSTISPATDVWALGLLAFWLLTGEPYWRSARKKPQSMHAIMREVLFEPLPPPSERAAELGLAEHIPAGFDEWFARCMVRDPAARISTAFDALEELEVHLNIGPRGTMPHTPSNPHERVGSSPDLLADMAGGEIDPPVSEILPPTLQSNAPPRPSRDSGVPHAVITPPPPVIVTTAPSPSPGAAAPLSAGPPTTQNGVVSSGRDAPRASAPSMPATKSTAPLWMLAGGLLLILVVILVVVKQRASAITQGSGANASGTPSASAVPTAVASPLTSTIPTAVMTPGVSATAAPPTSPTSSVSSGEPSFEPNKTFDRAAATLALKAAAAAAKDCKRQFGPTGPGVVKVTFSPTGVVISAVLITNVYSGNLVGTCVANNFLKLKVPAFEGTPVMTNMPFEIPQ